MLRRVQHRGHTQLCGGFPRGPPRVQEKLAELGHRAPATGFCYVGADGEGCTHQLVAPFEAPGSPEGASETHSVGRKLAGYFVHAESRGMSLQYHTAPV